MDTGKEKKLNRRRSFRIYEQVDILFQKLDINSENKNKIEFNNVINQAFQPQITASSHSFSSPASDQYFPDSVSKENNTLNVNISSNGISFTCKEELKPEDYLMIRVLMLSGMTLFLTCCKVVYCKNSNPFEPNQYPYKVGAQFVNLRPEDKELLSRYINKKRTRQIIAWGLVSGLFMTMITMPELVFELLLESYNLLIDNMLEVVFTINELIAYGLDHTVGYIFQTDFRTTQIISFYIQIIIYGIIGLYVSLRTIPSILKSLLHRFRVFYDRKKASIIYNWTEQSLITKAGIIGTGVIAVFCYGLFFI